MTRVNAIDEQKAAIDRLTKMLGYIDIAKSLAMEGGVWSEVKARLELEEIAETIRAGIKAHEENIARWSKKSSTPKTAQEKRDYFVNEAKNDVEFWLSTVVENVPMIKGGHALYIPKSDKVEFIVNRKNRKVTALIRDEDGHVFAKGIAKCAPDDCFNSHIGRAIALRRALGLGIPFYFLNTPQPTEVHVGDVVTRRTWGGGKRVAENPDQIDQIYIKTAEYLLLTRALKIIDDSREK